MVILVEIHPFIHEPIRSEKEIEPVAKPLAQALIGLKADFSTDQDEKKDMFFKENTYANDSTLSSG